MTVTVAKEEVTGVGPGWSGPHLERDIAIALTVTMGIERAKGVRVFERYAINRDGLDFIAVLEGQFVEIPLLEPGQHSLEQGVLAARALYEKLNAMPKGSK